MSDVPSCDPFKTSPVLIIDHRPVMRLALYEIFQKVADRVLMIDNGDRASALHFANYTHNCVVFSAHAPPHHDGLALLARLRTDGRHGRLVLYGASLDYDMIMAALRADIDGLLPECAALQEFADCYQAVSQGGKWLSQEVLHAAMTDPPAEVGTSEDALKSLTPRQQQIAHMVAQGQSNKQIACATGLSEGTVKMHNHRIFQRLNIPNRAALAAVVGDRLRDDHHDLIERRSGL